MILLGISNIRLQVNNDKLQSPPYLIEAIKQIENNQANLSIVAIDANSSLVDLSSLNELDSEIYNGDSSHTLNSIVNRTLELSHLAHSSPDVRELNLSESSNSNNNNNSNNNILLADNIRKTHQLPVTNSHLKKPFGSLNSEVDEGKDDNSGEDDNSTSFNHKESRAKHEHLSQVSPSVASENSVLIGAGTRRDPSLLHVKSDESNSRSTSNLEGSSVEVLQKANDKGSTNGTTREVPWDEFIHDMAHLNLSLSHESIMRETTIQSEPDTPLTNLVSSAGNQLSSSSTSSIASLDSPVSTDLSPLPEDSDNLEEQALNLDPLNVSELGDDNHDTSSLHHDTLGKHQARRQPSRVPNRIIEIPEKIVVTSDLSDQVPSEPVRLVVNKTRLGKPDSRCPSEGITTLEHPVACDKYFYCEDGYLIEQTCPNGLMYGVMNLIKDYCVHRWHANCVDKTIPNPISSPGCRWQYGVFSVQGSPRCTPDYYECIAGRFEIKKCSIVGQVYDDRSKSCQFADKAGCPEEILSDFQCPVDDRTNSFWPFPRYYLDEKTLIHCVNDKPMILRCADTERVDLEHLHCVSMANKDSAVVDKRVREKQKGHLPVRYS